MQVEQCGAAQDAALLHTRLSILLDGDVVSGAHSFMSTARYKKRSSTQSEWAIVPNVPSAVYDALEWVVLCECRYPADNVRIFLRFMEARWVRVFLGPGKPLAMKVTIADHTTSHLILVSPQGDDEDL